MISLPKTFLTALEKMTKQITELVAAVDNLAVMVDEAKTAIDKYNKKG